MRKNIRIGGNQCRCSGIEDSGKAMSITRCIFYARGPASCNVDLERNAEG